MLLRHNVPIQFSWGLKVLRKPAATVPMRKGSAAQHVLCIMSRTGQ
jgi:hypothetical protein